MAEPTQTTEATVPEADEVKPTRLQNFVNNHPKIARVLAITGLVASIGGAVHVAKGVQSRKHHLNAAGDHAKDALSELSATVTPTDPEA